MSCNGNCGGCKGCAGVLELHAHEVEMLQRLGEIPFLPVARKASDLVPVYLEDADHTPEEYSLILQCLEKKGLIDIDYHAPLAGFSPDAYQGYPLVGSMALTAKGQRVLEIMEMQGVQ